MALKQCYDLCSINPREVWNSNRRKNVWLLVIKSVAVTDYSKQWMFSRSAKRSNFKERAILRPKHYFVWTAVTNKIIGSCLTITYDLLPYRYIKNLSDFLSAM